MIGNTQSDRLMEVIWKILVNVEKGKKEWITVKCVLRGGYGSLGGLEGRKDGRDKSKEMLTEDHKATNLSVEILW